MSLVFGSLAEWFKAQVLGTCLDEAWVRIPQLSLLLIQDTIEYTSRWNAREFCAWIEKIFIFILILILSLYLFTLFSA